MKVLQINSVCGVGSTGRIATDLYKVLAERGHECLIAYGRGNAPSNINSIRIGSDFDNYIHVLKTRVFDKHGFGSIKATKKFIKQIEEYNPDIIQLHNIHGYYINIKILFEYLKKVNKFVVWTLHDCWAFTGHCAHFDYIVCNRWKTTCHSCPQKRRYPLSLLMDNSNWNYNKKKELFTSIENMLIVTPSSWLRNLVKQSFLDKYPVKVINNGIDLKVFKPTESDLREKYNLKDKFVILGVASQWGERKGLNCFFQLANRFGETFQIILVGVTEKQKKELPNNIIGITRTNSVKELSQIYTISDIFVNPTLEDTFPTTNIESLACGTPVITFKTGGSVESIDNSCGAIVEKENVEELITVINRVKEKNFSIKDCINKSKLYGKNDRYDEYVQLYEEAQSVWIEN